ncbi:MAG TPA: hypothetical protein VHD14_11855 [Pseudolabrys sp.]|nr:hypothetical protein [Pseudolabrys sp.]
MRTFATCFTIPCALALALTLTPALAAENGDSSASGQPHWTKSPHNPTADNGDGATGASTVKEEDGSTQGVASASGPDEPETHLKPRLPPLHLTDEQRQKIRAAVAGKDTEVTFQLKGTKPHKDFEPKIGAQVPAQLHSHALPSELTQQLPMLADYKYMKVKKQVLIVNPMTKKIVDMFPET